MRNLTRYLLVLVVAALGWGLYWFIGARATERGLAAWFEARRAEGWTAEAATLATSGFPNRFDTTFEGLHLSDPETGVGWSAPWFQILSLSYKPTHVIAAWPAEQELRLPGETLGLAATRMIGSLELGTTPALPLERLVVEGDTAALASSRGWSAEIAAAQLALREHPGAQDRPVYDLAVSLDGFAPDSAELRRLRALVELPGTIETLSADLTIGFDKAWDLSAIEVARPQPRAVVLEDLAVRWGDLVLIGNGAFDVGTDGRPVGELFFEATNWREMVAIAEASGTIGPDEARRITGALSLMAGLGGDPDRLDVTLRFDRGITWLGPIPVGAAPDVRMP